MIVIVILLMSLSQAPSKAVAQRLPDFIGSDTGGFGDSNGLPDWYSMPHKTREEWKEREEARKSWFRGQRMTASIAKSEARRQRIKISAAYINGTRGMNRASLQRARYGSYGNNRQQSSIRLFVPTPTGGVFYRW